MKVDEERGSGDDESRPGGTSERQWPLRLAGCLFGLGCCALGLFSLLGAGPEVPELNREPRPASASPRP